MHDETFFYSYTMCGDRYIDRDYVCDILLRTVFTVLLLSIKCTKITAEQFKMCAINYTICEIQY